MSFPPTIMREPKGIATFTMTHRMKQAAHHYANAPKRRSGKIHFEVPFLVSLAFVSKCREMQACTA